MFQCIQEYTDAICTKGKYFLLKSKDYIVDKVPSCIKGLRN